MRQQVLIFSCFVHTGGGIVIPQQGSLVGGKCQPTGAAPSEQVNITLMVRESIVNGLGGGNMG